MKGEPIAKKCDIKSSSSLSHFVSTKILRTKILRSKQTKKWAEACKKRSTSNKENNFKPPKINKIYNFSVRTFDAQSEY